MINREPHDSSVVARGIGLFITGIVVLLSTSCGAQAPVSDGTSGTAGGSSGGEAQTERYCAYFQPIFPEPNQDTLLYARLATPGHLHDAAGSFGGIHSGDLIKMCGDINDTAPEDCTLTVWLGASELVNGVCADLLSDSCKPANNDPQASVQLTIVPDAPHLVVVELK